MDFSRVRERKELFEILSQVQSSFDTLKREVATLREEQKKLHKMTQWVVDKLEAEPLTKEWYSVAEYASLKKMKAETIRKNYCQTGLINAKKSDPDDPRSSWLIHRSEIEQAYQLRAVDFGRA